MSAISRGSAVFVCTGYGDSRMALHGFAGRVVAIKNGIYLVRDGRGDLVDCCARELQAIDEGYLSSLPGVAGPKPSI